MRGPDLKEAIIEKDVEAVEKILKKELMIAPMDLQLWIKLSLTELQFPFEDYESALACINEVKKFANDNIDILILEAGIKWHSFGFIEDDLFEQLIKVDVKDKQKMAIIYYLQSLYFHFNKDLNNEELVLIKSIRMFDKYVYPYIALGDIALIKSKNNESKLFYQKAISNVQKVYCGDDVYDFTDIDTYIAEFITGTAISQINYEGIKQDMV
ncbi:hypothetical protein D3Z55_23565 [Clostridiaceae bacterium]|nr:hypothetical protein [Clostridiaceae bacterium]